MLYKFSTNNIKPLYKVFNASGIESKSKRSSNFSAKDQDLRELKKPSTVHSDFNCPKFLFYNPL